MQIFVPHDTFTESVRVLDNKRLNKQMVEADQIMRVLLEHTIDKKSGLIVPRQPTGWRNHPAVLAWRGYEFALLAYTQTLENEWLVRGHNAHKSVANMRQLAAALLIGGRAELPWWWGREDVHASHRSNLLRKDPVWYGQFGWTEPHDLEYVWPSRETVAT